LPLFYGSRGCVLLMALSGFSMASSSVNEEDQDRSTEIVSFWRSAAMSRVPQGRD